MNKILGGRKYTTRKEADIIKVPPLIYQPVLVLGIHDSFIIRADRHKNLQDIMEKAYISYMNLEL